VRIVYGWKRRMVVLAQAPPTTMPPLTRFVLLLMQLVCVAVRGRRILIVCPLSLVLRKASLRV
jgi:hypothetical protein